MDGGVLFTYALVAIIAIIIYYFFVRWMFSINQQLHNQEAQIKLLKQIAEKIGVPNEEVKL